MLSRYILLPILLAAGVILYLMVFQFRPNYPPIFIGLIMAAAGVLMLERAINNWWLEKNPPTSDPALVNFLYNYIPYYRGLPPNLRKDYERLLEKIISKTEFYSRAGSDLSDALKALCCIYPAVFSFQTQTQLIKKFNTVVFYGHPFLTPNFPDQVHVSEVDFEDGVYIYTIDHLQLGYRGSAYFNTALYEAAKVWLSKYEGAETVREISPSVAEVLEASDYGEKELSAYCGMLPDDSTALLIHHFFTFPEQIERLYPEAYKKLTEILGDYHVLSKRPVII